MRDGVVFLKLNHQETVLLWKDSPRDEILISQRECRKGNNIKSLGIWQSSITEFVLSLWK